MKKRILPILLLSLFVWGCSSQPPRPGIKNQQAFFQPSNWQQPIEKSSARQSTASESALSSGSADVVSFNPVFQNSPAQPTTTKDIPPTPAAGGPSGFTPVFEPSKTVPEAPASVDGQQLAGIASWYGPGFHGKATANGEKYNQRLMTAAHRVLPMNTWVQVTNLENNKSAVVRINDRGPYVDDRVIDLSQKAAERLDFLEQGTARVSLKVMQYPKDYDPSKGLDPYKQVVIQIAVFKGQHRATNLQAQLSNRYRQIPFVIDEQTNQTYHVIAGPYAQREDAVRIASALKADGIDNFVRSYRK
jgi:rare lipoprotein A